jgi:hypothetical protein
MNSQMKAHGRPQREGDGRQRHSACGYCTYCGSPYAAGALYCGGCGHQVSPDAETEETEAQDMATPDTTETASGEEERASSQSPLPSPAPAEQQRPVCPVTCDCGAEIPRHAKYCMECGRHLQNSMHAYRLRITYPDGRQAVLPITTEEIIIGKDPGCDVVLDDDYVSRRHTRISLSEGLMLLDDLGSSNGTLLRIKRSTALEIGDEIMIGRNVIQLVKNV